jgi:hypothetical protein
VARITVVGKAAKPAGPCGRCDKQIEKGDPYRHATPGFRGRRLVRCMEPACAIRQSELTTSKMAGVYAAQEDAEEALNDVDGAEAIQQILSDCADACREVAGEYAEAAEAMGGAGEEMQERADEIESYCDELENMDLSELEDCGEPEDAPEDASEEAETFAERLENAVAEARDLIGSLSL